MGNKIAETVLLFILAGAGYEDFQEKKIHLLIPLAGGVAGILLQVIFRERGVADLLLGSVPGAVFLMISLWGKGVVGGGDGMMLLVCGIYLGFWESIALLFLALWLIGITALFFIVIKRKGKHDSLPFVPFLAAAYLIGLL